MQCSQCCAELTGRQTRYCSDPCRKRAEYQRDAQAYKDRAKRNRLERQTRDPEGFKEYNRDRARRLYWSDPEKARAHGRAGYWRAPEQRRVAARAFYWRNPEPYRARALARVAADPEGHRAIQRERYYATDPDELYQRRRASRLQRLNKIRAYERKNREVRIGYVQARRARRRGNGGRYTIDQWRDLCARYGHRCLACGEMKQLTPDHIVPISRGGSSYISNIQPLCITCNKRKAYRIVDYRTAPVTAVQLAMELPA